MLAVFGLARRCADGDPGAGDGAALAAPGTDPGPAIAALVARRLAEPPLAAAGARRPGDCHCRRRVQLPLLGCGAQFHSSAAVLSRSLRKAISTCTWSPSPAHRSRNRCASGQKVTEALRRIPFVRSVAQTRVGRAETFSRHAGGTHQSEFEVDLQPGLSGRRRERCRRTIRRTLRDCSRRGLCRQHVPDRAHGGDVLRLHGRSGDKNVRGRSRDSRSEGPRDRARARAAFQARVDVQVQSPLGLPKSRLRSENPIRSVGVSTR